MKPPMKPPAKRGAPPPPKGPKGDAGGSPGIAIIIAPAGAKGLTPDGSAAKPPPKAAPKAKAPDPDANPAAAQKAGIRKSLAAAYKQQTSKR